MTFSSYFKALLYSFYIVFAISIELECHIDSKVNPETWESYITEVGFVFEAACGRNRGIFVTNPPDGHTYGCAKFPEVWNVTGNDANGIKKMSDPVQAVKALDNFVSAVYMSSPEYVRAKDPGACDMESMTMLVCHKESPYLSAPWASKLNHQPIRGVNLGSLFVLERWMLSGFIAWDDASKGTEGIVDTLSFSKKCSSVPSGSICDLYEEHINTFYTQADFDAMKQFGLNAVRITVGYWMFTEFSGVVSNYYKKPVVSLHNSAHPLTKVIGYAKQAGLQVILTLASVTQAELDEDVLSSSLASIRIETSNSNTNNDKSRNIPKPVTTTATTLPAVTSTPISVTISTAAAIASYISAFNINFDNILMIEINTPKHSRIFDTVGDKEVVEQSILKIRNLFPDIPILLLDSSFVPNENTFVNGKNVYSDIFLNTKVYHSGNVQDIASDTPETDREKMFAHEKIACGFKAPLHFTTCTRRPVLVGEFALAIDNCITRVESDKTFLDYGQCNHIDERADSPWWQRHTKSFAMRQIDTYERELGWVFVSYKLDEKTERDNPNAIYWSFNQAVKNGLIDLTETGNACAHKPDSDFHMGDATYPPSTQKPIYYWIPPNPTFTPTAAPVIPTYNAATVNYSVLFVALILVVWYSIYHFYCSSNAANRRGYSELPQADRA